MLSVYYPDQFEVEAESSYSGSYNDYIYFGSIFNSLATNWPESSGSVYRYGLASKSSGLFDNFRRSLWLYTDKLNYCSGTYSHGNSRILNVFSADESYFDSYAANPLAIYYEATKTQLPHGLFVLDYALRGNTDYNILDLESRTGFMLMAGDSAPSQLPDGAGAGSSAWLASFPFQTSYKYLRRIFEKTYQQTEVFAVTGTLTYNGTGVPTYISNLTGSQISVYNLLGFSASYYVMEASMSADQDFVFASASLEKYWDNVTRPQYAVFQKTFFGFGDGLPPNYLTNEHNRMDPMLTTAPQFYDIIKSGTIASAATYYCFGPKIRGFKYGLCNANPQYLKHIYRSTRFGQLRDRLEQPQYGKIHSIADGKVTQFVPLTVVFTASAAIKPYVTDYKTALTATWYNPKDSGMYDLEYRSGQPFFDDIGQDLTWM